MRSFRLQNFSAEMGHHRVIHKIQIYVRTIIVIKVVYILWELLLYFILKSELGIYIYIYIYIYIRLCVCVFVFVYNGYILVFVDAPITTLNFTVKYSV